MTLCAGCDYGYGDFVLKFVGNAEKILDYVRDHSIILKTVNCSNCGSECRIDYRRKDFRCDKSCAKGHKKKRRCAFSRTIFKGTWFDKSKLDVETNLRFCNLFLRKGFSYEQIRNELKISDNSINDWSSFCREVLISWCMRNSALIGGPGKTVEIDESKFGKRKYNVGRVIEGQWVFGGFCRESKDLFFVPVEKRDSATLITIIKDYVRPGTTIISDCWKAYDSLEEEGFNHLKVNHSYNFVDPKTGAHTNNIERKWRDAKRTVPQFGRQKAHFVGYLARVIFFKAHPEANKRLHHFLLAAAELYPPSL